MERNYDELVTVIRSIPLDSEQEDLIRQYRKLSDEIRNLKLCTDYQKGKLLDLLKEQKDKVTLNGIQCISLNEILAVFSDNLERGSAYGKNVIIHNYAIRDIVATRRLCRNFLFMISNEYITQNVFDMAVADITNDKSTLAFNGAVARIQELRELNVINDELKEQLLERLGNLR